MSAAELTRKKKQRGRHRSSTTRTINQTYDNLRAAEGINLPKLKQQETTLKEKLGILKDLDAEILALLPEDDIEDEIKEQDEYRESIQLALYDIEAGMNQLVHALLVHDLTVHAHLNREHLLLPLQPLRVLLPTLWGLFQLSPKLSHLLLPQSLQL